MNGNKELTEIFQQRQDLDNCYVYRESIIVDSVGTLHRSFPDIHFLYSIKCNNNPYVLRCVFEQGLGADAASAREVILANECGVDKNDIYFSAPGKTRSDIENTVDKSIIVADSLHEITLIDELARQRGVVVDIGMRINPDFSFNSNEGLPSKFGIDEDKAIEFIRNGSTPNIKVTGIHVHLKSQELNPHVLANYYEHMLQLADKFESYCGRLEFINMGSGMGSLSSW